MFEHCEECTLVTTRILAHSCIVSDTITFMNSNNSSLFVAKLNEYIAQETDGNEMLEVTVRALQSEESSTRSQQERAIYDVSNNILFTIEMTAIAVLSGVVVVLFPRVEVALPASAVIGLHSLGARDYFRKTLEEVKKGQKISSRLRQIQGWKSEVEAAYPDVA